MKRVVVTGLGAICAVGHTVQESWDSIRNGRSGVAPITRYDPGSMQVTVAAEIKDFDPQEALDRRKARRLDRFEQVGLVAATEAIAHSGLDITDEVSLRTGVAISSGVGGLESLDEAIVTNHVNGPRTVNPFTVPKIMTNGAAGIVSIEFGLRGPSFSVASACASGADGIGMSYHLIRAGVVDAMVAGGAECGITEVGVASFDRVNAMSRSSEHTPRPFSINRDGLVMGEGSAVLILESLEHAQARGAEILGEVVGYGSSADAYHITAPTEDGSGSAVAIRKALAEAELEPADIDYVNAHGTGTQLNDAAETKALKRALGERAYEIPVSSTKSMTGHMMGATGALEAVFAIKAIDDDLAPSTINYDAPDPECDLDYVPNEAREIPISTVMSNSFGFGGHNSVLIIRAFTG